MYVLVSKNSVTIHHFGLDICVMENIRFEYPETMMSILFVNLL
jgi:hypothetical protein